MCMNCAEIGRGLHEASWKGLLHSLRQAIYLYRIQSYSRSLFFLIQSTEKRFSRKKKMELKP